ncbi:hypothetical protein ACIQNG_09135 [Streptomyces sp. NPDC091377]|uniref:hypothetical protein n=1 Tax=Streptomyces sp. NPDC091377 TaxID=3365995 RepID=UPI0037F3AB88
MSAIRVGSAALVAVSALTLAAPAAQARGEEESRLRVSVAPSTVAAGGRVTLRAEGCEREVRISSGVFDDVTLHRLEGTATATVDRDAKKGAVYEVSFRCGNSWRNASLTIASGHHESSYDSRDSYDSSGSYDSEYPQRGVHAGEGGSLAGFDLKEIGFGLALIVGSVGAAYHFSRRRSEQEGG